MPHRYTPQLVEQIVYVGLSVPFGEAQALLLKLVGAAVPATTLRRLTERAGDQAVRLETEAAMRGQRPPDPPALLVDQLQQVSVDGAMVPLVHGEWAEVKNLAIGRVEPTRDGPRARDLSYFARLADHDTFRTLARIEFDRRATEHARAVAAVSDGAEWIPGFLNEHCPHAVRIIDWSHAAGYIAQAGQALFGPGTADCSAWVGTQLHRLWNADPQQVVDELTRLEAGTALEAVHAARQYLEKRLDQVHYASFRQAGYPVGSGIVESANKLVVEARLKGRGMHWARAHVDPMLVLRCTAASKRWEGGWSQILTALRRPHRRHQVPPPLTRPAPLPPPPTVPQTPLHRPTIINGTPTRAHPWKRYPACRAKS